ncbi:GIP [Symbiodinium sp. KB8]|nr:GIP [Symbiodinium sp. KB8]
METENPNLFDQPPSQPVNEGDSRVQGANVQQVMGAQIATASTSRMVNGTYGAVGNAGPLSMDGEVQAPEQPLGAQGTESGGPSGRAGDSGIGTLKAAAGRVIANVAAKVQGVLPPAAKASAANSFLPREDTGSAGTQGTAFQTAGSVNYGEQSGPETRGVSEGGLFSPQQARRLQQMSNEAPLLYAEGARGAQAEAEAIQAEVRKQMQVFMAAQRMVQLQNVVADLATARTAGALGFADWLHAIKPSMSDLSDSSGECWQQVLRQAQEWYTGEYVPAGPVARVRLKAPASMVDKELKWNRVRHRMEHLILQSCPEGVRAELSSARVSGVLNIMCRLYTIYKPGGVTERAEALRQVQQPRSADSAIDAVMKLRTWRRWMTRLSDLGGTQPDAAVCIQALEGITAGVLKGLPSLSFRVNLVRASLHLDTQPSAAKVDEFYEHLLAELEGVSRVTEATAAASVIPGRSESTKVRQVEAKASNNSSVEGSTLSGKDKTPKAPTQQGADSPKKLRKWFAEGKGCRRGKDCRFLHDWAQIPKAEKGDRCMLCGGKGHRKDACTVVTNGAMAKRDDGASSAKAARSDASPKAKTGDPGLRKVISEAATVLREAMSTSATAGDSNSPPPNAGSSAQAGEGSEAPPMAVAAKIQAQLQDLEARVLDGGASIRAVREDQALSLIHELESARLGELTGRIISQMVVDLQGANGWELLKAVPLNRRIRKRLHQSYSWLLHLGAGVPDPVLKQVCREQQIEIVSISTAEGKVVEPGVWKALSWAAFTGRLSGIVSDAPMRTWSGVKVDASHTVHLRTPDHPWGVPSNSEGHQSKVNNDAVFSLQPMWLWTIASIAQGSGIPFLQTHVLPQHGSVQPWMDSVVRPFSVWSNCSQFRVAEVSEAGARNRPMVVCSNLGFGDRVVGMNNSGPGAANEVCVSGWTASFKREVTMALFGTSPQAQATMQVEVPQVSAVGTGVGRLHSDRRQGQEESRAEGEALSPLQEEAEDSSPSPPAAGVRGKAPQLPHEDTRPASKPISEKDRERWRRHIAAHHIPFRKDCLKCVMAGALGLQHRRVKCPSMYALAFDLAGPFKERGKDDKGGGYKYVLVAGLRVPDIALPGGDVQEPTARGPAPASVEVGNTQTVRDDDEGSEVSWLNANLEPTAGVKHVSQHDEDSDHEQGSVGSWFEMPDIDDLPEPEEDGEPAQAEAEYEGLPDEGKATVLEGDLWEDALGVSGMSDEQFDTELSQMLFDGANKVLRFAVPVRSRKGPQILAALQEVVTECNRLGFPVKVAHTDRAKELMSKATTEWLQSKLIQPSFTQGDDPQANGLAERLVGWVKARARLHLAASGLGVEQWPAAMSFACTEHRHRMLQVEASLPRFGQKVIFKSKHPTGHSKRPFLRWEHAVYLCPTARTEGGHVLLRATSGAYLVAKNVRCVENLVDPEAELGDEAVLEADFPDDLPRASSSDPLPMPSRRVTGKRAVKAISLPSEVLAEDLRRNELFTPDHCGRLLELAFGGADTVSKRTHRGPMELAVVLGAYGHGGLHGVTRASRVYPEVCKYLNEYLRRNLPPGQVNPKWSAVTVVVAPEVAVHKDVRNEPGSVNFVTQVTTRSMWIEGATQEGCKQACVDAKGKEYQGCHLPLTQEWAELCELDEEQFEARISRWQRVLGGADEDPTLDPVSASIPHHLLIATVFQNRDWRRDPEVIANGSDGPVLAARVLDFSDDGPPDESPFPDRMLMFSVHDLVRDVFEMVILRVVLIEEEQGGQRDPMQPVLQMPGPPPPEVRAISTTASLPRRDEVRPDRLPVSLPNPTCIQVNPAMSRKEMSPQEEALLCKTEAATTKGLEDILSSLTEPLSVTHTASQEEVRANLEKWRPAIEKELKSLKEPGVLVSHFGKEARALIAGAGTTVIPLKGVFTTKAPGGPQDGLYRRKCRLVGCGNQASHIDADSLYAAGAPAELVRASLVQACRHQWSAFTCDIRSAFTQTPIPPYAARRYMLRPPRWLVELGLAEPDEYYSLGKVLYGFKEAPAWWSEHRDSKLLTAAFLGCHLEQGTSDPSLWRIMKGEELKGYLVTYVDDFLILSDSVTAGGLHQWLLEEAGWETDGLSEAKPGEPVRFLGMQLERHEDGHFSLNQESYIDELIRAYQLKSGDKSRIACPKEVLMNEPESVPESDEATVKAAQKVAGECLWLSQRTRFDISFSTAILCSRVSKDPSGALAIGKRLLCYLHQTKGFKLHLRPDPSAAPLRVFTDASFAPQGQHSFGGHIIELYGVPAVWRASRQGLIALSSAEAELIQAVEGCMFAESLLTVLEDLRVQCSTAQLLLDNTAAMAFIGGSGSQRTRHLKVRGHKIRQLIQSGWEIKHCPGEFQRADLLTKPLSAARMRFLRELLQLGDDEAPEPAQEREDIPAARAMQAAPASCVSALLMLLQVCACKGDEVENEDGAAAMPIDWPWELAVLTLLIVLSTLFVWEASGAPCRRRQVPVPEIRAVTVKERRAKKLQDRVAAAIDSAVSESPTGDEGHAARRKGRNKCPPVPTDGAAAARDTPTVVYGGINMHVGNHGSPSELQDQEECGKFRVEFVYSRTTPQICMGRVEEEEIEGNNMVDPKPVSGPEMADFGPLLRTEPYKSEDVNLPNIWNLMLGPTLHDYLTVFTWVAIPSTNYSKLALPGEPAPTSLLQGQLTEPSGAPDEAAALRQMLAVNGFAESSSATLAERFMAHSLKKSPPLLGGNGKRWRHVVTDEGISLTHGDAM